jgi:hypothetical protein
LQNLKNGVNNTISNLDPNQSKMTLSRRSYITVEPWMTLKHP